MKNLTAKGDNIKGRLVAKGNQGFIEKHQPILIGIKILVEIRPNSQAQFGKAVLTLILGRGVASLSIPDEELKLCHPIY